MKEMADYAKAARFGEAAVTYRIRDWGVSRQRFWGAPVAHDLLRKVRTGAGALRTAAGVFAQTAEFTGTGVAAGGCAGVC
jgi:leucyl-tRNA synthetase